MARKVTVHCTLCGYDVQLQRLGLTKDGAYDSAEAPQHLLSQRVDTFGGRANIKTDREPLPMPFALGIRDALKAALARVEAEIVEGGGAEYL